MRKKFASWAPIAYCCARSSPLQAQKRRVLACPGCFLVRRLSIEPLSCPIRGLRLSRAASSRSLKAAGTRRRTPAGDKGAAKRRNRISIAIAPLQAGCVTECTRPRPELLICAGCASRIRGARARLRGDAPKVHCWAARTMTPCLSGCHPQPLAVVFGHAHGRSPAWQSSVPTIAPRVPATFSRRRGLRRLPGEGSLERRVCLPPLSGGGRAVPLRKSSWRLALPQVPP